jgi:UDP-N-acetylmuramate--alanine ligase
MQLSSYSNIFFIGVAGTGMSAIAQYLAGTGKTVSGSDRYFKPGEPNATQQKLEEAGIHCYPQDGSGITEAIDLVVVSTAIEDTVPEVQQTKALQIPIVKRSQLLAWIAASKRTIAVAGTSGKSTTSAMLYSILEHAGWQPSIISGAGLTSLIKAGKIGNAQVGAGEWLVIEADESDGSIVQYQPEIGLLLNIDKDHQEISELIELFTTFKNNCTGLFSTNRSNKLAAALSANAATDFATTSGTGAGYEAVGFTQQGLQINFSIAGVDFSLKAMGRHSMENALAAASIAAQIGVPLAIAAAALAGYEGIYRRHQVLGQKNGVWVIDDYAHNPAKCAASIAACQAVAPKVIAWFQPHGYGPTRFLRHDFVQEIAAVLRPQDEIWMSEIFYAGGTAVKDISANDLITDIAALGKAAYFVADRNNLLSAIRTHIDGDCVLLLMGARDPGLEEFGRQVWENL